MSTEKVYGLGGIVYDDFTLEGANLYLNATLSAERVIDGTFSVAGLAGWTLGAGWSDGTGKAAKAADGVGTLTPAVAINAVVGVTYKIVYQVLDVTVGGVKLSYSGITDKDRYIDGTYIFYVTAKDTDTLYLTPSSNGSRFSIDNVSVKALTDATGDLIVDGNLEVKSPVIFLDNLTTGMEHGLVLSTKGTSFSIHSSSGMWNSVRNDLLYCAYNLFPGTINTKIEATEPIFKTEIDAHYYNGAEHLMEHNWSYLSIDSGTTRKPLGLDIDRTTHAVRLQLNSGADIPTLRLTDGKVGINTNMVDPVHALTVRADTANITLWLQGTNVRYRSGWALADSGLTVNCYDDTAETFLPMSFSSSDLTFKSNNGGYIYFKAGSTLLAQLTNTGVFDLRLQGYYYSGTKVVGARVIDARADDVTEPAFDGLYPLTAGLIDSLRDAMITHGLIAAT